MFYLLTPGSNIYQKESYGKYKVPQSSIQFMELFNTVSQRCSSKHFNAVYKVYKTPLNIY